MTHDEIIDAWNKQADYMNKWNYLGEDEKLEWAIKLEREACAKVCEANVWSKPVAWWRKATKSDVSVEAGLQCATAIRARGQA
jgi:hypothetical protein